MNVFDKLTLPNGSVIPNRIAKVAMEENMADASQGPSEKLMRRYETCANGGAGLLTTANVMVDSRAMTGPGGVVLEDDTQLAKFARWAQIGRSKGAQFWLQINHPGRQMQANLGQPTWATEQCEYLARVLLEHCTQAQIFEVKEFELDPLCSLHRRGGTRLRACPFEM